MMTGDRGSLRINMEATIQTLEEEEGNSFRRFLFIYKAGGVGYIVFDEPSTF